jgi:hypothetical protein
LDAAPRNLGLVLRDAKGAELWLSECICRYGGGGPTGSKKVLRAAGFQEEALEAITTYGVVHLGHDSMFPVIARPSSFKPLDRNRDVLMLVGENPTVVMEYGKAKPAPVMHYRSAPVEWYRWDFEFSVEHRCELYREWWISHPDEAILVDDDVARPEPNMHRPDPDVYRRRPRRDRTLILRDGSGRQLQVRGISEKEGRHISRHFGLNAPPKSI